MVFYLVITVIQYNSQNAEVQTEPKQPGPTVLAAILPSTFEAANC